MTVDRLRRICYAVITPLLDTGYSFSECAFVTVRIKRKIVKIEIYCESMRLFVSELLE
jgi:hypothetical protein